MLSLQSSTYTSYYIYTQYVFPLCMQIYAVMSIIKF